MASLMSLIASRPAGAGGLDFLAKIKMRSFRLHFILFLGFVLSFGAFPSAAAEFEGEFQVGHTSCTVTPIKMAFEVRWRRGKGYMLFFFDGKTDNGRYVFASEEKQDGKDRFEFEDERLLKGSFVRSDGKVFPVRKVQAGVRGGG